MDRIIVLGCGGSGKTRLARRIAALLGDVPVTHLDAVYYDTAWNTLSHDEFAARQAELVAAPKFVVEGNYLSTLALRVRAADTIIFLDLPAITCLWGIAGRRWRYWGGQHRQDGAFDRVTAGFLRYVLTYRRRMRPQVLAVIAAHGDRARLVTLTSRRAANRFLTHLESARAASN